ncbi:MAG: arginine--tRNA ligase [Thermincola sp.]|jgi:arginyl-tRNA synthetase|nr:arginine--tRNA ligase [Thermincola sp.]MDT3703527.1 arginine--tRNA ligase [Thermincola sp.]
MESVLERVKGQIVQNIQIAAENARRNGALNFETLPDFVLEVPRDKGHGDFATNIAMLLARQAKMAPRQVAEILNNHFSKEGSSMAKVEIAGPGFINFYLDSKWVYEVLPQIEEQGDKYGDSNAGQGKKVQVEFVSANPTGLLHMGNARGAALGDTMANLMQAAGFDVSREFYINDTGNQIENFGRSLEARYFQLMGQDVPFPEEGYHGQDIIDTVKGLIAADPDQKYLNMDPEARKAEFVEYALAEKLNAIRGNLSQFGVNYDVWFSEKTLHDSGAVSSAIAELRAGDYIYENEGAIWLKTTAFGEEKDEVLVRGNGIPTYFAADIAYHKNKFDRGFQWVINIWGADHHGHVARLKGAVKALGYESDNLDIVLMQLVRLFKGGEIIRMSKRSGEFITLEELIAEVGKDAARYFFVMRSPDSHLDFDMDLAKSQSTDNPVYYIQYAHARICSILRQMEDKGGTLPKAGACDLERLQEPAELELIRKLVDFPTEISAAAVNLEPHRMARYAHELAGLFHSFYNSNRVMVDDEELQKARLVLVKSVRAVVRRALGLLGLTAPESM